MLRDFLAVFFGVGTWADARDRKKKDAREATPPSAAESAAPDNRPFAPKATDFEDSRQTDDRSTAKPLA